MPNLTNSFYRKSARFGVSGFFLGYRDRKFTFVVSDRNSHSTNSFLQIQTPKDLIYSKGFPQFDPPLVRLIISFM